VQTLTASLASPTTPLPEPRVSKKPRDNEPRFEIRTPLHQLTGAYAPLASPPPARRHPRVQPRQPRNRRDPRARDFLGVGGSFLGGTRYEVRGTRYEVRGTRYEVRGTRYEVRGTRYEVRGTR
jgi:hypothetical protein